jgi:hypothetical protein
VAAIPPADPPTLAMSKRQLISAYIGLPSSIPSDSAVGFTDKFVKDQMQLNSQRIFKNMLFVSVQIWGPGGLVNGDSAHSTLTLIDSNSFIKYTDRGMLNHRARVGMRWPPPAQRIYKEGYTTESGLFQVQLSDYLDEGAGYEDIEILVKALVWS